jgi:hypothetical protein
VQAESLLQGVARGAGVSAVECAGMGAHTVSPRLTAVPPPRWSALRGRADPLLDDLRDGRPGAVFVGPAAFSSTTPPRSRTAMTPDCAAVDQGGIRNLRTAA